MASIYVDLASPAAPAVPARTQAARAPRAWLWLLMGMLTGGLAAALVAFPARWLSPLLAELTQQRIVLTQAQGSLWQGQAQLTLGSEQGRWQSLPGHWQWRVFLGWQGEPRVRVKVQSECCLSTALVWDWRPLSQGAWTLQPLKGQADAAWLEALGSPWNTMRLRARIAWETDRIQGRLGWSGLQFAGGQARVGVSELSSVVSPVAPLGRYQVQIALESSALVSIQTEEGPLRITGEGEWVGQSLRFRGLASADAPHGESLQPLLSVLGQRQGAQAQLNF